LVEIAEEGKGAAVVVADGEAAVGCWGHVC
jgi:hypothetical protein